MGLRQVYRLNIQKANWKWLMTRYLLGKGPLNWNMHRGLSNQAHKAGLQGSDEALLRPKTLVKPTD
jgi:hypothetical protein